MIGSLAPAYSAGRFFSLHPIVFLVPAHPKEIFDGYFMYLMAAAVKCVLCFLGPVMGAGGNRFKLIAFIAHLALVDFMLQACY